MKPLRMRIKIYQERYHGTAYIANVGGNIRMSNI